MLHRIYPHQGTNYALALFFFILRRFDEFLEVIGVKIEQFFESKVGMFCTEVEYMVGSTGWLFNRLILKNSSGPETCHYL